LSMRWMIGFDLRLNKMTVAICRGKGVTSTSARERLTYEFAELERQSNREHRDSAICRRYLEKP
jgi:hypothetical protein